MRLSYDPVKRARTLAERGLDFEDAAEVLGSERSLTVADDRFEYGEVRYLTYGRLSGTAVAIVWTDREAERRIISMRRMHQEEVRHVGLD